MTISNLDPTTFANYTIDQLLSIPPDMYSTITEAQISALSKEKMRAIHIDWLSDSALAGLTAQNITGIIDPRYFSEWIWPEQMALISKKAFAALEKTQLAAINTKSFAALTVDQLLSISDKNYSAISAAQLSAVPKDKMHAIHIDWLSDSAFAGLTAQNITGITDPRYFSEWIWPEQIQLIRPSAIAALTDLQFSAFSRASLDALTPQQVAARFICELPTMGLEAKSQNNQLSLGLSITIKETSKQSAAQTSDSIGEKIETSLNFDAAGNESVPKSYVAQWDASANKLLQTLSLNEGFNARPAVGVSVMGEASVLSAPSTHLVSTQWMPAA